MKVPKAIANLIDNFQRLPGIGPKTAQRLTFFLLHFPEEELQKFADCLVGLKRGTRICSVCRNVGEEDPCGICMDSSRDRTKIVVTGSPLDVFAFEKVGFDGLYQVLHGVINPLENIGPEELFIRDIVGRLRDLTQGIKSTGEKIMSDEILPSKLGDPEQIEVILATNTSMEGEVTAMYIAKMIRDEGFDEDRVLITRIARGLPVGGDIEYADDITLTRALEGRMPF